MGCDSNTKVDGFTVATPQLLKKSLAQKLVPVVDKLRDLNTRFGTRPYRVRIVRTLWSGKERGQGTESVIQELEIVPTPVVVDLNTLQEIVTPVGQAEIGLVQLREVSGRYTEDHLSGVDPNGNHPGPQESVFFEIEFFRPDGQNTDKHRFSLAATPYYNATGFQWTLVLDGELERRRRDGRPR